VTGLHVEELTVHYGGVCAVNRVSFTVHSGQSVGIIGANGAGKTSTLRALMGLVPRSGGRIRYGEHDLTRVKARDMVRHGIGYVPEGRHIFPGLSVEKNLLLGAYARGWRRDGLVEVYELFPVLGEMRGRLAGALSGGQQQMLAIGRALMSRPRLLLLDEPAGGLGGTDIDELAALIRALPDRPDGGCAVMLVEHHMDLVMRVCEHVVVLDFGRVIAAGPPERIRDDPAVADAYLGTEAAP
jgi:branched-chain amino acid transport system ATP-binding protein